MKKDNIAAVRQVTRNSHLNYFELEARTRSGKTFPYYMASRACREEDLYMNRPDKGPDGVTIYALGGPDRDRVVLVRQYRFPVGDYVYEFPAGLVEDGEDYREAAVREMKEETGMELEPLEVDPMYEKPLFMTDGLTDENCAMVYGYCSGEITTEGLEDTERLQVILADRDEVRRILKEERLALTCGFMLMHFLHDGDPFAFLEAGPAQKRT